MTATNSQSSVIDEQTSRKHAYTITLNKNNNTTKITMEKQNNSKKSNNTNLKTLCWNCNRIYNKMELFKLLVKKLKPNIIALSEIKLNQAEANDVLSIEGYDCIYKLRNSNGGGSAIFVDEETEYTEINLEKEKDEEIIGIRVKLDETYTSIFQLYTTRPVKRLTSEC